MICERCGDDVNACITSMFSFEVICIPCKEIEKRHPKYEEAHSKETAMVRAGEYNFPGIGTPPDLVLLSIEARKARLSGAN